MSAFGTKLLFHFGIILAVTLVSMISASCNRPITCPCGPTRREIYYTHCLNETLEKEITCERWANCRTCEANVTYCLTCHPERSGPTCGEVKKGRKTCRDPGIPEGGSRQNEEGNDDTNTYPRVFQDGESVYFMCNEEESVLEGRPVITCTSAGTWSDSLPRCQKPGDGFPKIPALGKFCKYPRVDANGMIENLAFSNALEDRKTFPSTTRLKFNCKEGYKLEGSRAIFCLCSGEWTSDPPICLPEVSDHANPSSEHCEGRGPISNGRVVEYRDLDLQLPSYQEYGALYPVGSRLHYSCNKGYSLRGTKIIVCESSGLWSAKEPKCIEEPNLSEASTPKDPHQNFIPSDEDRRNFVPNDDNPIRNSVPNSKTFRSREERHSTGSSNSFIFKFFFF
ncbi:unnamed protein product [Larinioides sclopetarius]|uniref:Sushi domain-containing protein n=1 Tax=Larinioides sclopetarius TaxID=280406 RepID=A0AAV2BHX4_9ARAC